jgi:hypothetical protein
MKMSQRLIPQSLEADIPSPRAATARQAIPERPIVEASIDSSPDRSQTLPGKLAYNFQIRSTSRR